MTLLHDKKQIENSMRLLNKHINKLEGMEDALFNDLDRHDLRTLAITLLNLVARTELSRKKQA